jgi:ATP-dependent helicase/nuclease subunit A
VRLNKSVKTSGFDDLAAREVMMNQAQELRLLYVAATRARDHLVVSLHHQATTRSCQAIQLIPLCEAEPDLCRRLDDEAEPDDHSGVDFHSGSDHSGSDEQPVAVGEAAAAGSVLQSGPIDPGSHLPDGGQDARAAWADQRAELVGPGGRPRTLAATTIAEMARERARVAAGQTGSFSAAADLPGQPNPLGQPNLLGRPDLPLSADSQPDQPDRPDRPASDPGLDKDGTDVDLPPWRRGRAGTAVGRAVHAVLQTIDFSGDHGDVQLGQLAGLQATAEGVPHRTADIARRVRAALDSEIVHDAVASGRYWRELYVGTPVGDRTLEGFIDLLIAGPDGYVVVDYKTDASVTDADLDRAVERYRLQGATYALAVQRALGVAVTRCVFLFLRAEGAVARDIDGLDAAMDEVEFLVLDSDRTGRG